MSIDVTKMERKEPIGAEQDDDTNSVLSLEQILQSPNKSFSTKEIVKIIRVTVVCDDLGRGGYPDSGLWPIIYGPNLWDTFGRRLILII